MNELNAKRVFVTGTAGFIGAFLTLRLLSDNSKIEVLGLDNLNSYYDPKLKESRLELLNKYKNFSFVRGDLENEELIDRLFQKFQPDIIVNIAAQAGVRYSIEAPKAYISSNIVGFFNILEACRKSESKPYLIYASSSSVYGSNVKIPYSIDDKTDSPESLYAATKKSNELMARTYSKLYQIPTVGLRFFTVYGPMGRPDMAYFKFAEKIRRREPIQLFNNGNLSRDFTYIDDIVQGIVNIINCLPKENREGFRYKLYNIGGGTPVNLTDFVDILERVLTEEGVISSPAIREYLPMQPGDVYQTCADTEALERDYGFTPSIRLEDGLRRFAKWYKKYKSE